MRHSSKLWQLWEMLRDTSGPRRAAGCIAVRPRPLGQREKRSTSLPRSKRSRETYKVPGVEPFCRRTHRVGIVDQAWYQSPQAATSEARCWKQDVVATPIRCWGRQRRHQRQKTQHTHKIQSRVGSRLHNLQMLQEAGFGRQPWHGDDCCRLSARRFFDLTTCSTSTSCLPCETCLLSSGGKMLCET